MRDETQLLVVVCFGLIAIFGTICFCYNKYHNTARIMADRAYCETTIQGRQEFVWQKCK